MTSRMPTPWSTTRAALSEAGDNTGVAITASANRIINYAHHTSPDDNAAWLLPDTQEHTNNTNTSHCSHCCCATAVVLVSIICCVEDPIG